MGTRGRAREAVTHQANRTDSAAERLAVLRRAVLFGTWPEPVLARLARASRMEAVPAGATVMKIGQTIDAIYVLASGSVSIGATDVRGRRLVLKVDSPGEFYGLLAWARTGVMKRHDAVTQEPSTLVVIPTTEIDQVLKAEPTLWRSIALEASRRLGLAIDIAMSLGLESLRVRFARQILHKTKSVDATASAGDPEIRMSQHTMAELLGVSRQTITTLAGEFGRRGLIRWRYGRILVLDLEGLRQAAQPGWRLAR